MDRLLGALARLVPSARISLLAATAIAVITVAATVDVTSVGSGHFSRRTCVWP